MEDVYLQAKFTEVSDWYEKDENLRLIVIYFIVSLFTYKSDIETFSHLTLMWFLLDL